MLDNSGPPITMARGDWVRKYSSFASQIARPRQRTSTGESTLRRTEHGRSIDDDRSVARTRSVRRTGVGEVAVLSPMSISEPAQRQRSARQPPWMSLAIHAGLMTLAFLASFALRFDFDLTPLRVRQFATALPLLLPIRLLAFRQFGIFRLYWRHIGARDLFGLVNAVTLSSLLFVFGLFFLGVLTGMPRSVLIIDWVLTIFFCGGVMYAARYLREVRPRFDPMTGRRTLLVGAGGGAELLLRQVRHDREHELSIVGIVDDDPSTHEQMIHGVPVLGSTDDMARLVTRYRLELLVITVQHATQDQM